MDWDYGFRLFFILSDAWHRLDIFYSHSSWRIWLGPVQPTGNGSWSMEHGLYGTLDAHGMGHNACACMQDGVFMDFFFHETVLGQFGPNAVFQYWAFFFSRTRVPYASMGSS